MLAMKKRIGSKLYDTESSELVCRIDGGQLYRKRSREREWFAVYDDGRVRPLDVSRPQDVALMETGNLPADAFDYEPHGVMVRVDPATLAFLKQKAAERGISVSALVRKLARNLE